MFPPWSFWLTISFLQLVVNGASPPQVQDLSGLHERLDDLTRSFLVRETSQTNYFILILLIFNNLADLLASLYAIYRTSSNRLTKKTQITAKNSNNPLWMTSEITSLYGTWVKYNCSFCGTLDNWWVKNDWYNKKLQFKVYDWTVIYLFRRNMFWDSKSPFVKHFTSKSWWAYLLICLLYC